MDSDADVAGVRDFKGLRKTHRCERGVEDEKVWLEALIRGASASCDVGSNIHSNRTSRAILAVCIAPQEEWSVRKN